MNFSRSIALVLGMLSLVGVIYASDAPPASPVPSSAAAAPAQAAPSQDAPTKVAMTKDLATMVKRATDAGFKPEMHHGEVWYCKKDIAVGSRLPSKRCANEAGLLSMLDHLQEQKDAMRNLNPTPGIKQ